MPPSAKVIGIVGTAKNTGKTTALAALLGHWCGSARSVAVTGIGYDGEAIDTVTSLPKPRLAFAKHAIVATAQSCVDHTDAGVRVAARTGIPTALGEVVIAEITRPGEIVVAGPNTKASLARVLDALRRFGPEAILVDGSLNRIAPMAAVDVVVFATGAARALDARFLAQEMRSIECMFGLPRHRLPHATPATIAMQEDDPCAARHVPAAGLFDTADVEALVRVLRQGDPATVVVCGFASAAALGALCDPRTVPEGAIAQIVLRDPIACLLAGEPVYFERLLATAAAAGIAISVAGGPRCAAMTVNPFYPRLHDHGFTPAYLDKTALLAAVSAAVHVPVLDVMASGPTALARACLQAPAG